MHAQTYPTYANFKRYLRGSESHLTSLRESACTLEEARTERAHVFTQTPHGVHLMAEKHRRIRRICASPFTFFPLFFRASPSLSLSLPSVPVSRTPPTYDHMTPFSRPSALKRSIEAVYRILQKRERSLLDGLKRRCCQ